MSYEIVKPEGAPEWFTPGIKCRAWEGSEKSNKIIIPIVWYNCKTNYPFIDEDGTPWSYAEPIEKWIPKENEAVAMWNNDAPYFIVFPFNNTCNCMDNIAKYDGRLDIRVETLKDAPRYKC